MTLAEFCEHNPLDTDRSTELIKFLEKASDEEAVAVYYWATTARDNFKENILRNGTETLLKYGTVMLSIINSYLKILEAEFYARKISEEMRAEIQNNVYHKNIHLTSNL